jgi:hypothetical protein
MQKMDQGTILILMGPTLQGFGKMTKKTVKANYGAKMGIYGLGSGLMG